MRSVVWRLMKKQWNTSFLIQPDIKKFGNQIWLKGNIAQSCIMNSKMIYVIYYVAISFACEKEEMQTKEI